MLPRMTADQHAARRAQFLQQLGDAVAVIPAGRATVRNPDVEHEFRQESNFYFLTGFPEPEAVAVFDPQGSDPYLLFVRPRDPEEESWTGTRAGVEGARADYGADAAFPLGQLSEQLFEASLGRARLYYRRGRPDIDRIVDRVLERGRAYQDRIGTPTPGVVLDPLPILAELRLRKSPIEADRLRRACRISAEGHKEAMRVARPGLMEYQVQAALEYCFRRSGSPRNGYPSIVASGPNACILHYTANDRRLEDGDLLLIDAGAEFEHFSGDITRTFPVGGRFRPEQRAVYELVLAARHAAADHYRPGEGVETGDETARRVLAEGMVELGLVPGGLDETLAMHHYRKFFFHGTSHWLGMDVHDAGSYRERAGPRRLEPGMALTVEPGVYLPAGEAPVVFSLLEYDLDVWRERRLRLGTEAAKRLEQEELDAAGQVSHPLPAAFRGFGIRIEDDLLITEEGHENLTGGVPVDPDEVEELCAEAPALPT